MTPEEQEAAKREEEIKKRYGLPATGRYYPPYTPGQRGSYVYGSTSPRSRSPYVSSYRSYSSTIGMRSNSSPRPSSRYVSPSSSRGYVGSMARTRTTRRLR
jgi:hypothetical protein